MPNYNLAWHSSVAPMAQQEIEPGEGINSYENTVRPICKHGSKS